MSGKDIMEIYNSVMAQQSAESAPAPVADAAPPAAEATAAEAQATEAPAGEPQASDAPAAETQPQATEPAPAATEPAPAPQPDKAAKRLQVMTRMQRELDQRRKELDAKAKEIEAKIQASQQPLAVAKPKDPFEALRAAGFSLADLNEHILRGGKEAPPADPLEQRLSPVEQKLKALEDELAASRAAAAKIEAERAQDQYNSQVNKVMGDIAKTAENYDLIKAMGPDAHAVVFNVMVEYANNYDKILTYDEACGIVEQDFEERYLERLAASTKLKSKLTASAPKAPEQQPAAKPTQTKSEPKTLANSHGTAVAKQDDYDKMKTSQEQIDWLVRNVVNKTT